MPYTVVQGGRRSQDGSLLLSQRSLALVDSMFVYFLKESHGDDIGGMAFKMMIREILPHVILIPPIPHLKRLTQTLHLVKTCSQKAQSQCQHLRSPLFQNLSHHQTPNLAIHVCLLEETMVPKIYGGQPSELGY